MGAFQWGKCIIDRETQTLRLSIVVQKVPVYILAGGKSSRFGSDKARALVAGKPLILRVAENLKAVASSISVIADVAAKYSDLGFETIADDVGGLGPLGGLKTALRHRGVGWLFLTSCDVVSFNPQWIELLQRGAATGSSAAAFKTEMWQPLPALYHSSIGALVERHIAADTRALWKLLDAANAVAVPAPRDWAQFRQVNTQQELTDYSGDVNTSASS
jgi:molybdenum cofactor guanylyltransferase